METVSFVHMADGTKEDYALLDRMADAYNVHLPERLMAALDGLEESIAGYQVSRYEHSLQGATRAFRDGRDEEYIVATLLHDIGDELAPWTHGEMTGAILKPFVRPEYAWMVRYHGVFQLYYYAHHSGGDPNVRDRWKDSPYYDATVEFCAKYDQNCFDPDYDTLPAAFFEPMVRRVFAEPRYLTGDEGI